MAESTAIIECNPSMDTTSESTHASTHGAKSYVSDTNQALRPISPMEDIKQEDIPMGMTMAMSSPIPLSIPLGAKQRPAMLKGSKSSSMLRSVTAPHPLSMSTGHSLQHFQSAGNSMYAPTSASIGFNSNSASNSSSSSSIFSPNTPVGPLSAPSSPSFPNTSAPNSAAPSSFMAMHGHNSSLYEPFRRNSVPILTAEQAEHKRMVSEEKQHMHRQGSWSALSSSSSGVMGGAMNGVLGVPPVLHHLDATHLDPATMHYYRTQFTQQQLHMQQHPLNQVIPSSNSSNCPSPMPENFMAGNAMSNGQAGPGPAHHSTTGAIRGNSTKVKRNNSICSTTSVSSTGSGSNNKHPCKFPSCEWSFKRYEHLKRHMLVHTKERPFQCDFTGCNKSFSRSDNFSAHLRTHSKKALAHRRYSGLENGGSIKQESQDSQVSSGDHQGGGMAGFMSHPSLHMSNSYSSNSISQDASEYGRDYSPPESPGRTPTGRSSALDNSSSMNDDDSFDMMGHSSYSFGNNSMYSLDHLDHLNSMVPRFDTIHLDLKSVAPGDIHKQYSDDNHPESLISSQNPNGESPRASPMPQYDHFSFPSSISTHFMPMMPSGFSADQSNMQQHQQQQQNTMGQQMSHESLSSNYSSLPSAESFHHQGYHSENDLKSLQFSHVKAQRSMAKFPLKQQRQAQTA
ncbi:hypothetical protein BGX26_008007 [Mortierella sp. AD094]|nr:hypothetical protein BGX26_008007 [Mortierella sp. AD094]